MVLVVDEQADKIFSNNIEYFNDNVCKPDLSETRRTMQPTSVE